MKIVFNDINSGSIPNGIVFSSLEKTAIRYYTKKGYRKRVITLADSTPIFNEVC